MEAREGSGGRKGGLYIITAFNQQTRKPLYHYIKSAKKAPSLSTGGMVEFH